MPGLSFLKIKNYIIVNVISLKKNSGNLLYFQIYRKYLSNQLLCASNVSEPYVFLRRLIFTNNIEICVNS